jgi:hypothetical protein
VEEDVGTEHKKSFRSCFETGIKGGCGRIMEFLGIDYMIAPRSTMRVIRAIYADIRSVPLRLKHIVQPIHLSRKSSVR